MRAAPCTPPVLEAANGSARARGTLAVLLCTEGTYPYASGGVSTWCDRLCRELADVDYVVYAVTRASELTLQYEPTPNAQAIVHVPLRGGEPADYVVPRLPLRQLIQRKRATSERAVERSFLPLFERVLHAMRTQRGDVEVGRVMHGLWRYFRRYDWHRTWRSRQVWDTFVRETLSRLEEDPALRYDRPSVHDLTTALRSLASHLLPLAGPIPRVDIVHSTIAGFAGLPGIVAKHEHGTPFLVTEHGVFIRERYIALAGGAFSPSMKTFSPYMKRFLLELIGLVVRLNYAHADVIAPVADFNRRWEVPYGADPARIETIYHGVDPDVFIPGPKPAKSAGRPTVVAAARVVPVKDIETMIRGAAVVRDSLPDVHFVVHGPLEPDPSYVERCRTLIAELGLQRSFELAGLHRHPPDLYTEGDISVLSSISEGLPYAALESMSCARPVVATDVGGVKEALAGVGVVVPPRDPQALGDAMVALLTDDDLRLELGRRSRERVLARFRADRSIAAYRRLYDRMLQPEQETLALADTAAHVS